MAMTFRAVKGAKLTSAEIDANFHEFDGIRKTGIVLENTDNAINDGGVLTPYYSFKYIYSPASAPAGTIVVPQRRQVNFTTSQSLSGGGHIVAGLDHITVDGTGNPNVAMVHEAKMDVTAAATVSAAVGSEVNVNVTHASAVVSSFSGYRPNIVSNVGTITTAIAHGLNVQSNAGAIGVLLGMHFPDLSGVANIGSKRCVYNQDAAAHSEDAACAFGPIGLATGQERAPMPHGGFAAGRYYLPPGHKSPFGQSVVIDTLYATPFPVAQRRTFTKIGLRVTTAQAAKSARLGIYKMANGIPTSLVADCGTVSVAATGPVEVSISQQLEAGMYALAVVTDASTAAINFSAVEPGMVAWMVGSAADNTADGSLEGLMYGAHTFGALPSTFPAVSYFGAAIQPRLWLRA